MLLAVMFLFVGASSAQAPSTMTTLLQQTLGLTAGTHQSGNLHNHKPIPTSSIEARQYMPTPTSPIPSVNQDQTFTSISSATKRTPALLTSSTVMNTPIQVASFTVLGSSTEAPSSITTNSIPTLMVSSTTLRVATQVGSTTKTVPNQMTSGSMPTCTHQVSSSTMPPTTFTQRKNTIPFSESINSDSAEQVSNFMNSSPTEPTLRTTNEILTTLMLNSTHNGRVPGNGKMSVTQKFTTHKFTENAKQTSFKVPTTISPDFHTRRSSDRARSYQNVLADFPSTSTQKKENLIVKHAGITYNTNGFDSKEASKSIPPSSKFEELERYKLKTDPLLSTSSIRRLKKTKTSSTTTSYITPPPLIPTLALPSRIENPTDTPSNTVESLHYLPWINEETTSFLSEQDLDNMLYPSPPSVYSLQPTKPMKSVRVREKKIFTSTLTSGTTVTIPSSETNKPKANYYKYGTSTSGKAVTSNPPHTEAYVMNVLENYSKIVTSLSLNNAKLSKVRLPNRPTTSTEILPPEILPTVPAMDSVVENLTQNCTNDYCVSDEDYYDMMLDYMFPTTYEWVLIGMHIIVFIVGLIGNSLVCVAVYRNHSMRTVTNYFIVNLAIADFLVILLCLPPSVLWDVTETWFMGTTLCKIVLYFQTVSVAVSVLTLTFISVDRWYAICCPLKFKSTTGRAKTAIVVIWVLALAFDIPELVVLETRQKELSIDTLFFTQCEPSWSDKTDMAFHCLQTLLLYTIPLVFMSIAYCQIVKVLWSSSNIPGHKERLNSSGSTLQTTSCRNDTIGRKKKINRCTSVCVSTGGQVIGRRKAAKMLVAVVIVFAVCYFPVHLLSILRYTLDMPQTDATTAFSMVSHWLCYANSAVNPLIYNFMSGKFRKEFQHTFGCRRLRWKRPGAFGRRRRRRRQAVAASGEYCGNGRCRVQQRTEMVPLSGGCATNIVIDVEIPC